MKLVIIFGPQAVGKMTVGQELAQITGLKLFHNHMTIDVVSDLFRNMPDEFNRLRFLFRQEIFEAFSKSGEYGMIFTFVWRLDEQTDWEYIEGVERLFASRGAEVYYVELEAGREERRLRNVSENRLLHKSSKRDIERSEHLFNTLESMFRQNTFDGEITKDHYIKIDNTHLSAQEAAERIQRDFAL